MRTEGKSSYEQAFDVSRQAMPKAASEDLGVLKAAVAKALSRGEINQGEESGRTHEEASRLVDMFLKSTSGSQMSLEHLDAREMAAFLDAPAVVWEHLGAWRAEQGMPITGVTIKLGDDVLPAQERVDNLCVGLALLADLGQLDLRLPVKNGQSIQLDKLLTRSALSITVTGAPGLHVTVPAGCDVTGSGSSRVAVHKAWVHYVRDGQVVETKPLANFAYFRQPTEFLEGGANAAVMRGNSSADKNEAVAKFNKNGFYEFPALDNYRENPILCRHLTSGWLDARIQYHAAKRQGSNERFSFGAFAEEKLAQAMARTSERDFRRAECTALFTPDEYGKAVAWLFGEMMKEGKSLAHFMISTTEHVLGLELQIDTSPSGNRVFNVSTFYDPVHTITHAREVTVGRASLDEVATQRFERWAVKDTAYPVYTMHHWPPPRGNEPRQTAPTCLTFLGEQATSSVPGFDTAAMKSGDPRLVKLALSAKQFSAFGFQYAMERGLVDAVRLYVGNLLSDDSITGDQTATALMGHTAVPLFCALQSEEAECARTYADMIANTPVLPPGLKVRLLRGSTKSEGALVTACRDAAVGGYNEPADRAGRRVAIHAFASEIAKSNVLTPSEKGQILSGAGSNAPISAIRAAMPENPGAAAAIICAILENTMPKDGITRLLREASTAYGPSLDEVLSALATKGDAESLGWVARTIAALPGSGVDGDGILQRKYAAHE